MVKTYKEMRTQYKNTLAIYMDIARENLVLSQNEVCFWFIKYSVEDEKNDRTEAYDIYEGRLAEYGIDANTPFEYDPDIDYVEIYVDIYRAFEKMYNVAVAAGSEREMKEIYFGRLSVLPKRVDITKEQWNSYPNKMRPIINPGQG